MAVQDPARASKPAAARQADLDLLLSLSGEISGKVLCALGDFATSPVTATVKQFGAEYRQHIELGSAARSSHG